MKPTSSDLISTMKCSNHFEFSSAFRPMHVLYGKIESSAVLGSTKKISGGCSFVVTNFVGAQGVTFPRTVMYKYYFSGCLQRLLEYIIVHCRRVVSDSELLSVCILCS